MSIVTSMESQVIPTVSVANTPGHEALIKLARESLGMVALYQFGGFVFIGEAGDGAGSLPGWLHPICEYVWKHFGSDCSWVRFDDDAEPCGELPLF